MEEQQLVLGWVLQLSGLFDFSDVHWPWRGMGFSSDRHLSISPSFLGGKEEGFSLRSWWRPARIIWGLIVNQHFFEKEMGKKWALVSLEEKNESYFSLLKPPHPKSPYLCDGDFYIPKNDPSFQPASREDGANKEKNIFLLPFPPLSGLGDGGEQVRYFSLFSLLLLILPFPHLVNHKRKRRRKIRETCNYPRGIIVIVSVSPGKNIFWEK